MFRHKMFAQPSSPQNIFANIFRVKTLQLLFVLGGPLDSHLLAILVNAVALAPSADQRFVAPIGAAFRHLQRGLLHQQRSRSGTLWWVSVRSL